MVSAMQKPTHPLPALLHAFLKVSFCSFMVSTSPVTFLLSLLHPLKAGWKTEKPPPRLSQSFLYFTHNAVIIQCRCELAPLTTVPGSEARLALWFTGWLLPRRGRGCVFNECIECMNACLFYWCQSWGKLSSITSAGFERLTLINAYSSDLKQLNHPRIEANTFSM